jgi:hypothetical protein
LRWVNELLKKKLQLGDNLGEIYFQLGDNSGEISPQVMRRMKRM